MKLNILKICMVINLFILLGCIVNGQDSVSLSKMMNDKAQQRNLILLPVIEFDPIVVGEPNLGHLVPKVKGISMIDSGRSYYIVQFKDNIKAEWQDKLIAEGVSIYWYIPNNSRLIGIDNRSIDKIRSYPFVRWIGEYQPAMKVKPEFLDEISSGQIKPTIGNEIAKEINVILFKDEDLDSFVRGLEERFPDVRILLKHEGNRYKNVELAISVQQVPEFINSVANTKAVCYIEHRKKLRLFNDTSIQVIQNGPGGGTPIWNNYGIMGQGQVVAVADSGLDTDMCFFRHSSSSSAVTTQNVTMPNAVAVDNSQRKVIAYNTAPGAGQAYDHDACSEHGTHVSGSVGGDNFATLPNPSPPYSGGHDTGDGMAPLVKIFFEDIGYVSGTQCALNFPSLYDLLAQERVSDASIRISTNSWGDVNRTYTQLSLDTDAFMWDYPDFVVLYAMGNSGAGNGCTGIGDPATAKNCISVGAVNNASTGMTSYSSPGPPSDGRIKPDISCPGGDLFSSRIVSAAGDESITSNNCSTKALQGTSMATPTCAGGTAMVRQYFMEGWYPTGTKTPANAFIPSAALVKAVIINGGYNMTGDYVGSYYPNCPNVQEDAPAMGQGWGRMHLENSLYFSSDSRKLIVWDKANSQGVGTGQVHTYNFTVNSSSLPLRITLVWTDPEAAINCGPCLVDNLDLEVTAPSGTYYRGNQFTGTTGKVSTPNPSGADALNNVEGILVNNPTTGNWTISVKGTNVPGQPPITTQGYALVVTGDVSASTCTPPVFDGVQSVADNNACVYNGIQITWNQPSSWGQGATSGTYEVRRYTTSGCSGSYTTVASSLPANQTSYIDTTASPNTTYYYQIIATNNCSTPMSSSGTNSCSAAISDQADEVPCPAIGNTLLVNKSGTYAIISWTAVNCNDLANYEVYGSTSYSAPFPSGWTLLNSPTSPSSSDPLNSPYIAYKALTVDLCGNKQ